MPVGYRVLTAEDAFWRPSNQTRVDNTDLASPTDTCYVSPVQNYAPAGAVSLWLRLNFDAPAPSFLYVGAVAVHVK